MNTVHFQEVKKANSTPHSLSHLPVVPAKPRLRRYTGKVEDLLYQEMENLLDSSYTGNHPTKPLRSALVFYVARITQSYMDGISASRLKSITAPLDTVGLKYISGKIENLRVSIMKDSGKLEILVRECKNKPCEFRPRAKKDRPARRSNLCLCKSACPDKLLIYVGLFKDALMRRDITDTMRFSDIVKQYK